MLKLPIYESHGDSLGNIDIDSALVCGPTGTGKSNVVANIIQAALNDSRDWLIEYVGTQPLPDLNLDKEHITVVSTPIDMSRAIMARQEIIATLSDVTERPCLLAVDGFDLLTQAPTNEGFSIAQLALKAARKSNICVVLAAQDFKYVMRHLHGMFPLQFVTYKNPEKAENPCGFYVKISYANGASVISDVRLPLAARVE